jgi:hypothetical protein
MRSLATAALLFLSTACSETTVASGRTASPGRDFVAGRAVLTGELATTSEGCLMASLYPAGQNMPILTYRVDLDDPSVSAADGARVFAFRLDSRTSMIDNEIPAGIPLEVGVRFDRDCAVETTVGDVKVRVAAEPGDDDVELTLAPGP